MSDFSATTEAVIKWFRDISDIPRESKKEEKIRAWLLDWAKGNSYEAKTDEAGNVVVKVPATPGYENSPICVLQGHLDMVCEKTPDSKHNFDEDPIEFVFDGDWLKANKTTLGADNGIAIAMALAMVEDKSIERPALELLFTVDEETGLTGANALGNDFIDGKILLNIDSEDEGVFTIGCAGGIDTSFKFPVKLEAAPAGKEAKLLKVGGLKGGHSGVDIDQQRGNAIKVLARAINHLSGKFDVVISDVKGGSAHNAIPRDAEAVLYLDGGKLNDLKAALAEFEALVKAEYELNDPGVFVVFEDAKESGKALSAEGSVYVVDVLLGLPHGIAAYSTGIPGLVETSNNMATVEIKDGNLEVLSSQRSSVVSRLEALTYRLHSFARLSGGTAVNGEGYPPWEANWNSALLEKCKAVFTAKFNKEPVVEIIHAGLECGIIGAKYDGMDMISIGPTIKNPHSPDECLKVSDIDKIWDFMVELFKSFK